jgi:hypothetical protein
VQLFIKTKQLHSFLSISSIHLVQMDMISESVGVMSSAAPAWPAMYGRSSRCTRPTRAAFTLVPKQSLSATTCSGQRAMKTWYAFGTQMWCSWRVRLEPVQQRARRRGLRPGGVLERGGEALLHGVVVPEGLDREHQHAEELEPNRPGEDWVRTGDPDERYRRPLEGDLFQDDTDPTQGAPTQRSRTQA